MKREFAQSRLRAKLYVSVRGLEALLNHPELTKGLLFVLMPEPED